ncbi:MAG: Lrp/AsnC ligand binding domain-containing protein [Chloroflexota bacterium]
MKAIVLLKLTSIESRDAYCRLTQLASVKESFVVYGRYDAVVIIQAENLEEIRRIILSEIQIIPGVIDTLPCLIVEDEDLVDGGGPQQLLKQAV